MSRRNLAVFLAALSLASPCTAQANPAKRPMTFDDMMAMKRLGETAVSPDGKWLAYSITTVNLAANTRTPELWLQKIEGGNPIKLQVAQPGDSGVQFSADGKRILFLSSRSGSQQIWLASFDTATGATGNPYNAAPLDGAFQLTHNTVEPDNARWSPDGNFIVFNAPVYPDCPPFTEESGSQGSPSDTCNAERDKAANESKVKAQIFTQLLYRHWNHFTGPKRSHLFYVTVQMPSPRTLLWRDLTPNDPHDVPPFSLGGDGGFSISPDSRELAFTENPDPVPAISTSAQIYTLDLTDPAAKPMKVSTSAGGNFSPAYSPDGKYLAWRSQARAGYESDKFRLMLYNRADKTSHDLLPEFDNWVDEFAWGPASSNAIYFTSGVGGESPVFEVDGIGLSSTSLRNKLIPQLTGQGEYSSLYPTADGKRLIATRMTVAAPGEVVALHTERVGHAFRNHAYGAGAPLPTVVNETATLSSITHLNDPLLATLDLPNMESFWFTAADQTRLQGFVIKPPAFDTGRKYPLKFLIHGGPQGAWGDSWS